MHVDIFNISTFVKSAIELSFVAIPNFELLKLTSSEKNLESHQLILLYHHKSLNCNNHIIIAIRKI